MSWRNLRSISTDPLSNFLSKLAQDQIFRESQQESAISDNLEEDRFIGKTFYSICEIRAIKQPFATKIPVNTVFLTPEEPDLDRMRLWVKFDSGAYSQFDHSLFHNEVLNKGYMLPVAITSATYDEGIVGGKIALMYNNIDSLPKSAKAQFGGEVAYTRVTDNQNIRLSSYLNGTITGYDAFCISMLVRPMQLYLDTDINGIEGWNRRLCSKIDDSNLDYAYEIRIAQEGSLIIIFRRAGTDYLYYVSDMFEMSPGADFNPLDFREGDFRTIDPVTGVIYDTPKTNIDNHFVRLDVIYKFSDNSVIVRMDNQDQTVLPLDPSFATWPSNPTIHTKDLLINSGPFAGNFADRPLGIGINEWADFRIYVGELTSQESTNLYTNKYSISDIGFGKVALSGYTLQNNDTVHLPDITKDIFGITKLFPTKDFGSEWFSAAWNNGISRIIQNPPQECSSDPYDNQLSVSRAGDPRVTIQGNGIMKLDASTGLTGSPRVVILSNTGWKNVESTVYMRCPTITISGMDVTIRAKTEHYCVNHPTGGDDDDVRWL
jgi:hypothetical protein